MHNNIYTQPITELTEADFRRLIKEAIDGPDTIPISSVPDLCARDAARFLGCSVTHLKKMVKRHPEKLRPVPGHKSYRFYTQELKALKDSGLVKVRAVNIEL